MNRKAYTVEEMRSLLDEMSGKSLSEKLAELERMRKKQQMSCPESTIWPVLSIRLNAVFWISRAMAR